MYIYRGEFFPYTFLYRSTSWWFYSNRHYSLNPEAKFYQLLLLEFFPKFLIAAAVISKEKFLMPCL
jgi:hypothetical protein